MDLALWIGTGVGVYMVGFIISGVIEQMSCDQNYHDHCNHPWQTPGPLMWPLFALLLLTIGPFVLVFTLTSKAPRAIADRIEEHRKEESDRQYQRELNAALQDKIRNQRTRELELENGIQPSYDNAGNPVDEPAENEPRPYTTYTYHLTLNGLSWNGITTAQVTCLVREVGGFEWVQLISSQWDYIGNRYVGAIQYECGIDSLAQGEAGKHRVMEEVMKIERGEGMWSP